MQTHHSTADEQIYSEDFASVEKANMFIEVMEDLATLFEPHVGQIEVGKALFYDGKIRVFVKCGRKWGKTTIAVYTLFRWAMTIDGGGFYYIAPFLNQGKELIWADRRLHNFLTPEMIKKYDVKFNESELRVRFGFNGSFIKVDGADNLQNRRGINPHGVVVDETKDIKKSFWEGFEPNLLAHSAPILMVGTPPDNTDNMFTLMEEECQRDDDSAFFNMPSSTNHHVSHDFLMKTKDRLIARGEEDVWQREYLAQTILGGNLSIFPMLDEERHVLSFTHMLAEIRKKTKHWEFFVSFDPGTSTCFGVLIGAVNIYDKRIFILDELYETKAENTTSRKMWTAAMDKCAAIHPILDDWIKIYDYAAAWFRVEISNEFNEAVMPCEKDLKNKENKLSIIKDSLLRGYFYMSSKNVKLFWEMSNYRKNDKGKILKENDHLIDNLRYMMNAAHYTSVPENEIVQSTDRRGFRLSEERFRDDDEDKLADMETFIGGDLDEYYDY